MDCKRFEPKPVDTELFSTDDSAACFSSRDKCMYLVKKPKPGQGVVKYPELAEADKKLFDVARAAEFKSLLDE